ncbi:MAG: hypothetical protein HY200_10195 [Nitrospirae bacterium]|nr:hypothetical protein [Nitrospirota bacterium]
MKLVRFCSTLILLGVALSMTGRGVYAVEPQTTAGASKIVIVTPKEGDHLPASDEVQIEYQFVRGMKDNGNHVHVYLDGENEGTSRRSPRGLGKLAPGKHTVLLKVSNQDHEWVNVEATVQFEVSAHPSR